MNVDVDVRRSALDARVRARCVHVRLVPIRLVPVRPVPARTGRYRAVPGRYRPLQEPFAYHGKLP